MRMLTYLTILLLTYTTASATETLDPQKSTSFHMISTKPDYIGKGKA